MSDTLVVVVSYNNAHLTKAAIESLNNQRYVPDVIMWDNNSNEGQKAILTEIRPTTNITKIFSPKNLLWSPAINLTLSKFSKGYKYIGFMNNDIMLPPHAIEFFRGFLDMEGTGVVGPMGSCLGGIGDYVSHMTRFINSLKGNEEDFQKLPYIRGTYLVGACCFMLKNTWDEVGPLDSSMPLGADDHDHAIRVREKGYGIYSLPSVYAQHVGHASGGEKEWNEWGQKSWDSFNKKYEGYYRTRAEAILCHWNSLYVPGWEVGTGWKEDVVREPIYEIRRKLHDQNLELEQYRNLLAEEDFAKGF